MQKRSFKKILTRDKHFPVKDWDDFRFYLSLGRHKTLKAAARELGTDQATVGRRIRQLERNLETRLFEKGPEGFVLTETGARVFAPLEGIEESFQSVARKILGHDDRAEGKLRVAMPGALANHVVIPALPKLFEKFPGLEIECLTGPVTVNLMNRDADIAVRFVEPGQKQLFRRRVGHFSMALYASRALQARLGLKPAMPEAFPFVALNYRAMSQPELAIADKVKPSAKTVMKSSAWTSIYLAVKAGLGVGILPTFLGNQDPTLTRLDWVDAVSAPIWLVLHPDLKGSARVKAFTEFLGPLFGGMERPARG